LGGKPPFSTCTRSAGKPSYYNLLPLANLLSQPR
jgi:hypothetical protein